MYTVQFTKRLSKTDKHIHFFRLSIRLDWITGGLGSTASHVVCFFSSCRITTHLGASIPQNRISSLEFFPFPEKLWIFCKIRFQWLQKKMFCCIMAEHKKY